MSCCAAGEPHGAVNGFEGVSLTELHSARAVRCLGPDHDGCQQGGGANVLASLAEDLPEGSGAPPDAQTLDRFSTATATASSISTNSWREKR